MKNVGLCLSIPISPYPLDRLKQLKRYPYEGMVMVHILLQLRSIQIAHEPILERITRLKLLFAQYRNLLGNADAIIEILPQVETTIKAQTNIWCLASIQAWATDNLIEVCKYAVDLPLVPMFVHRYDRYLLENEVQDRPTQLEAFCNSLQTQLYWEGQRPNTLSAINTSMDKWVLLSTPAAIERAGRLAGRRQERKESVVQMLLGSDFGYAPLKQQLKLKDVSWGTLQESVEKSIAFSDICAIRDTIIKQLDITSNHSTLNETHAMLTLYRMEGTQFVKLIPFIDGVLQHGSKIE